MGPEAKRRLWERGPRGPVRRAEPVPEASGDTEQAPPSATHPRFWRTVRRGVREAYDYLGTVLAVSGLIAVAAVIIGPATAGGVLSLQGGRGAALARALWHGEGGGAGPSQGGDERLLWVALVVAAIVVWTLLGPLMAGIYRLVRQIVAREDPAMGDLFREARRYALPGMALAAVQMIVGQVLFVDMLFFLSMPAAMARWIGLLFFYPLLFWGLVCQYQWPLLAEGGEPARPVPAALTAVKKSALLVLDNLPFSLGIGACAFFFTLFCGVTAIGAVLLWAGGLAFLDTVALRELLRKYGILPPEPAPDDAVDLGYGWHE